MFFFKIVSLLLILTVFNSSITYAESDCHDNYVIFHDENNRKICIGKAVDVLSDKTTDSESEDDETIITSTDSLQEQEVESIKNTLQNDQDLEDLYIMDNELVEDEIESNEVVIAVDELLSGEW